MHERGLQLPKVVGQQHDFLMVAIDTGNFILAYEEDLEEGLGSEYERLWVEDVPLVLASDASVVLRRERFGEYSTALRGAFFSIRKPSTLLDPL